MVHMVCCRLYCILKADINLEDSAQNSVEMNDWRHFVGLMPVVPALGSWGRPILSGRAVSSTQWSPVLKRKGNLGARSNAVCRKSTHLEIWVYSLQRIRFFFLMKSTRVCLHRGRNEMAERMKVRGSQRENSGKRGRLGSKAHAEDFVKMYSRFNNLGKIQTGGVGGWFSQGAWISFD